MFKVGDKIQRKDGSAFSNDAYVNTVASVEHRFDQDNHIWIVETSSWIETGKIELVKNVPAQNNIIEDLEFKRSELTSKIADIDNAIEILRDLGVGY